jgi:hypothetical protein
MMNDSSTCPDELDHGSAKYPCRNTKRNFYGGKHHLKADKVHFYSALMTSPPDPPFSKKTSPPPMACKGQWGRGKRGGGKQFEAIGNRKIIPRKLVTYVWF